ncbi:NAD-dependent epimerase/dehydratase family protein [Chitinophaga lutea]
MSEPLHVIVTGATGMVGEGVLDECLRNNAVSSVLCISRKHTGIMHPKLKELILPDFFDPASLAGQLSGYNACFFCAGVSSIGMDESEYHRLTYKLTLGFAEFICRENPGMTFCYVSGAGTDSSAKGRVMWARVKGETENDLMKLPFRAVYAFRPAFMKATKGQKNLKAAYKALAWTYPLMRKLFPGFVGTVREVGLAMIHVAQRGYDRKVLEVPDIRKAAQR